MSDTINSITTAFRLFPNDQGLPSGWPEWNTTTLKSLWDLHRLRASGGRAPTADETYQFRTHLKLLVSLWLYDRGGLTLEQQRALAYNQPRAQGTIGWDAGACQYLEDLAPQGGLTAATGEDLKTLLFSVLDARWPA